MSKKRNLCDCGRSKEAAASVCRACYLSNVRRPVATRTRALALSAEQRFWAKVARSDDPHACWIWTGARDRKGYGKVQIRKYLQLAHRVSWEMANGPVPDGLWVLHHCDNPPCIRHDHLFLGTRQDNVDDMKRKGRGPRLRGEFNPRAKVTWSDIEQIRARSTAGQSANSLGPEFGVSKRMILNIIHRKNWTR